MARPIKRRTVKSYTREIEQLGRLRTAIQIDMSLDSTDANVAIKSIDKLISNLAKLQKQAEEKAA